jgi:peptidoglycan-associated lipoprotein
MKGNLTMNRKSALLITIVIACLSAACAPPTAKLKVSRTEVNKGDPVTVSWETKNSKQITLNGQTVDKVGAKTVSPDQTTTYEVLAKRGSKEARDRSTVKVNVIIAAAPTINLRAEPSAIEQGQNAKLTWSATNARVVQISGMGDVPASGERQVSPRVSTTYTGTAMGDGGSATASARVTVGEPAPLTSGSDRARGNPSGGGIAELFGRMVTAVYFELDSSELRSAEQEKLRRAAEWLRQDVHRTIVFRIEGNCDPRGTAEYNLGLGDRRARAAKSFLVSLGIEASRMDTISYGLEKAQGTNDGTWARDRRDDFVYVRGGQ